MALNWPDAPALIRGDGPHAGKPPRGAGIVAVCELEGESHVCICEKRNGAMSFPKGGMNVSEGVLLGALREWCQETGVAPQRLQLLRGISLDEPGIGCRYLLARCALPDEASHEPDVGCRAWQPPLEDPDDRDPIIRSSWLPVRAVLARGSALSGHRLQLLRWAVASLSAKGGDFVPPPGNVLSPQVQVVAPELAPEGLAVARVSGELVGPAPREASRPTAVENEVSKWAKGVRR